MADLLSTGVSGLLAAQVGLSTVGHNVSNANTDGYSRQLVSFTARAPQQSGSFYVGTGVDTQAVQRAYSQFLNTSLWSATSGQSRATAYQALTGQINNQLSGSSNLQTSLDSFFGAMQDVANAPADPASRQVLLARGTALASTFHALSGQFSQLGSQVQGQITNTVDAINSDTASIAKLNEQIRTASSASGQPSDLLDQRDALVKKLSGEIGVSVVAQNDGTIGIYTGNGQALVTGAQAHRLGTAPNGYDATRLEVVGADSGSVISGRIGGGTLGALLDFRSNVLDPAQNQLGRAALAIANALNAQHAQGVDLKGAVGGTFFNVAGPAVQAASGNLGSATVTASIGQIGALTNKDYVLAYDGSAWNLRDGSGNAVAMTGTGTAADPFQADGLELVVGAGASSGDSFRIQPSSGAAASLGMAIDDPNKIAAAKPLLATAASGNSSSVGGITLANGSDPNLFTPSNIIFSSPTSYSIDGGAAQAFTPGQPIVHNGWSLQLAGAPAAGDSFVVKPNSNARGDNSNALALGAVANLGVLDNGVTSVGKAYGQLVSQVGSAGALANDDLTTQTGVLNQAMAAQQAVSGVNIDEEAANLVRYQQAYQASAQVISTTSNLFNALLGAVKN